MRLFCQFFLLYFVTAYIELPVLRVPHSSKPNSHKEVRTCPKEKLDPAYSQICYEKDISHSVQLYYQGELYLMGLDLTIPISWIKSPKCKINNDTHACKRLEKSVKEEITQKIHQIKKKIKEEFDEDEDEQEEDEDNSTITTIGGINKITGKLDKAQNLEFWTKDSDKLTSLYKVFLIGLFLTDQKEKMSLVSTNFINATQIDMDTNILSDGAISLRFDEDSENSFLNEIFNYVGSSDKIITFSLGNNATVTIGDLSVKNSEQGYAGISWVAFDQKAYPLIDQISIQTIGKEQIKSFESSSEVIFTLSASYISIPEKQIKELEKNLHDVAKCLVGNDLFLECDVDSLKKWKSKRIIFQIGEAKVSFDIQQLQKHKKGKEITLNIRQSQTEYIIFGEPVFKKYYIALDYHLNRIGIANHRVTFEEMVFETLTLIRVLVLVFVAGLLFIICYKPVENLADIFQLYNEIKMDAKGIEAKGLKYSQFNDGSGYEDLNTRLRDTLYGSGIEGI